MGNNREQFFSMIPTILFAVAFIILIFAGSAAKANAKKTKKMTLSQKASLPTDPSQYETTNSRNSSPKSSANAMNLRKKNDASNKAYRLLENRENDWLARQLREEAVSAKRFSAMYGLKRMHEANCPARSLRNEHRENCDAEGIDSGTAR